MDPVTAAFAGCIRTGDRPHRGDAAPDLRGDCVTRTETLRVVTLNGGLRSPSSTEALARAVAGAVVAHADRRGLTATVTAVEVREHALDATAALLDGERTPSLVEALRTVQEADVLVVASPVYNGSYAGPLKTFTDLLTMEALAGLPTVLAATGGSYRHTLAVDHELRPLLSVLQAAAVPTGVYATGDDWAAPGVPDEALSARIDRAAWEVVVLATGLAVRPGAGGAPPGRSG
jgi:FMN reductase